SRARLVLLLRSVRIREARLDEAKGGQCRDGQKRRSSTHTKASFCLSVRDRELTHVQAEPRSRPRTDKSATPSFPIGNARATAWPMEEWDREPGDGALEARTKHREHRFERVPNVRPARDEPVKRSPSLRRPSS